LTWTWPARGAVIAHFGDPGLSGKGVDIAGKRGDSVLAAAAGTVVYAGSGLVGYGKLLILRHDDNFISAYAYNDRFLVREGERVKQGQAIAVMGASGTDRDKLHFEIREHGKPVDPLRLLPDREAPRQQQ
jgi:lipoprotein NlpD